MIQNLKFARINTDADEHDLKPDQGEYRMMENLVPPQRGVGRGSARNSMDGTLEVSIDLDEAIQYKCIGTIEDAPNARMFFFLYEHPHAGTRKDKIYVYDANTKTTKKIVDSEFLGWSENLKITGIQVLDEVLYWTDYELKYFRIQDDSQLIEINYYVLAIPGITENTYYFQAASEDGTITINISAPVTGPLSVSDVLDSVASQFNAISAFSTYFLAEKEVNAEVIKITSKSKEGNWLLTNNSTFIYFYFSTNYDAIPQEAIDFTMYPISPSSAPEITPVYDASIAINSIVNKNFQFAYRLLYTNNQISVLSPFSEFKVAARFPENLTSVEAFNAIDITLPIYFNKDKLKSLELLARNSITGDWFVVKEFNRSELFVGNFGLSIGLTYRFIGTEVQIGVATADAIKQQEGQPLETTDLQIQKNKLFVIENKIGFNVDPGDFQMTVTLMEGAGIAGKRYLKEGGNYNYALRFFDEFMRTDGTVHKRSNIRPRDTGFLSNNGGGKWFGSKQWAEISLTGKPPIWANFWTVVRSDELFFHSFFQARFRLHYFVRILASGETEADFEANADYYAMWGNVYKKRNIDQLSSWTYIHIHMPTNIPYVVERGMIVNFSNGIVFGGYGTILDVQGPMIILEKLQSDLVVYPTPVEIDGIYSASEWFEIFSQRTVVPDNSFHEIGQIGIIGNPGEETRQFNKFTDPYVFNSYGDLHHENNELGIDGDPTSILYWKFDFDTYNGDESHDDVTKRTYGSFESYSASYAATKVEGRELTPGYDFGYILDPSLETRNLGRPAPLLPNVREEERPSTIRWSNDYVANAAINGLHTFEPLNEYPLPLERGPIIKLQNAGEDVMLAIHSSGVTSLYIGKGIIRSADLNPTLITTEGVIGADTHLKYSFGTIHPESVSEVDGNVYFWDGIRNEPVRYAQNGLTSMATTFFTRVFFKKTIPSIFGTPDQYSCRTGYDRLLDMIWWTFDDGTNKLTIGFHEKEKAWICKAGFTPEYFGSSGETFLGFMNGVPWIHNADPVNVNNFYGTYYPSKATIVINMGDRLEKAWDGIVIDSNKIWDCPNIYNEEGQSSNLIANDFVWRDNLYYADFLRDINTPSELLKADQIAIRHGKFLSSQVLTIELELNEPTYHYIQSIGVAATMKAGHNLQVEKQ